MLELICGLIPGFIGLGLFLALVYLGVLALPF